MPEHLTGVTEPEKFHAKSRKSAGQNGPEMQHATMPFLASK
jgi:hypothetical protein